MLKLSTDRKKFQFQQQSCHSRFNQIGKLCLSNRYNSIDSRREDPNPKSSSIQKSINIKTHNRTKSITEAGNQQFNPQQSQRLEKQVSLIKKMGLLGGITLKHIKYQGHIRIPTVHNDYHSATSNPGYSRKPDGGIYPK